MTRLFTIFTQISMDSLPHYLRIASQFVFQAISTGATYAYAFVWSVNIAPGCTFVGVPSFSRTRESSIRIGRDSRLLSSTGSNRHGLNRPCMISTLRPGAEIVIGEGAGLSGTVICAAVSVTIGDFVLIGANTTITDTDSHPITFQDRTVDLEQPRGADALVRVAPVVIESGVFIGMHSLILKGVRIGRGTVVGAGSVVSSDLPEFCIAAGNPARPIKFLNVVEL